MSVETIGSPARMLDVRQEKLNSSTSAVNSYITLRAKQQICSFLFPMENTVKFNLVNMQVQQDTASCGLFSIAVAAELVAEKDPAK